MSNESPIWIESELLNTPMVLYGFIICSVPNPLGKSWESGVREARCWVFHCSCPPAVQFPRWRNALKSWGRSCSCSALAWDGWIHQPYLLGFHEEKWCYHADNIYIYCNGIQQIHIVFGSFFVSDVGCWLNFGISDDKRWVGTPIKMACWNIRGCSSDCWRLAWWKSCAFNGARCASTQQQLWHVFGAGLPTKTLISPAKCEISPAKMVIGCIISCDE